jgi:4-methyl-5(b-hydroxyethyl)-thiazole monophosphate biosynthesis
LKQRKILLLLSNGFEILEASAFIDVMGWNLEEGNKTTRLFTAAMGNEVSSSFNMHFKVDFTLDKVDVDFFDALVIPGGFKSYNYYEDAYSSVFLNLIQRFKNQNKIIASVCVGALPLAKSGVLKNKKGTTYNNAEYLNTLKKHDVVLSEKSIVIEDKLITSNGPSTAIKVAFILLEMLTDKENSLKIKTLMGY